MGWDLMMGAPAAKNATPAWVSANGWHAADPVNVGFDDGLRKAGGLVPILPHGRITLTSADEFGLTSDQAADRAAGSRPAAFPLALGLLGRWGIIVW